MASMIEVKELTKYFGAKLAVDHISFTVEKGEILGFLGPNAAGKSTTMRMITGFLPPTSGTAVIGGKDILEQSIAARKKIGYLPENAPVYEDMTVKGFLEFVAELRGYTGKEKAKRVEEILSNCFLQDVRYQSINTLSKGFRQRVCFAQSIIHDPEYLIMDEPTDGLDPNQKHEVRTMIREMAREKTIILSTHILEEMEAVCTRAIIIANGKIVVDEKPETLKARSAINGAVRVTIRYQKDDNLIREIELIEGVKQAEIINQDETSTVFRAYPENQTVPPFDQVMRYLHEKGISLENVHIEEGRLDEVFRSITTLNNEDKN
jgi:ABC-2 type transport system ATP-binding protein